MGLFDNFMDNTMQKREFLNYVKSYSANDLMHIINDVYREMKGMSSLAPYMGDFGSIEFAGMMLMWRYASVSRHKNRELYCDFLVALADQIGCAFNHMSALECSDRIDNIINNFPQIMSYSEWRETYDYLKENHADRIRACEFNEYPYDRLKYDNVYIKFIEIYNSLPDIAQVFDYFESEDLGIKRALFMLLR